MSFASELRSWVTAAKELVQDEHKKHPYLSWLALIVAFIFALASVLSR